MPPKPSMALGTSLSNIRLWHHVPCTNRILGRLASRVALTLMGKHKPTYEPHIDSGDYVVLSNAKELVLTGKGKEEKKYRWHSSYPGGLKERSWAEMMQKRPEQIIKKAVAGMLPKNVLRRRRLQRLYIYMNDPRTIPQTILANCMQVHDPRSPLPPSPYPAGVRPTLLEMRSNEVPASAYPNQAALVNPHAAIAAGETQAERKSKVQLDLFYHLNRKVGERGRKVAQLGGAGVKRYTAGMGSRQGKL